MGSLAQELAAHHTNSEETAAHVLHQSCQRVMDTQGWHQPEHGTLLLQLLLVLLRHSQRQPHHALP
jgi:hypothetical protein